MIIKRYRLSYDGVTCDVDQLYIENIIIQKKEKKTEKGKSRRSTATKHHMFIISDSVC